MEREYNFIIGISGASGSLYSARMIRALSVLNGRSSCIISEPALRVYSQEIEPVSNGEELVRSALSLPDDFLPDSPRPSAKHSDRGKTVHEFLIEKHSDFGAKPASGSISYDGMIIIPCSMKTLSSVACANSSNLMERAADVTLKERRRLVLVIRESPYNLIHLRNMTTVTEAGGVILPASPGFYNRPTTIVQLADFIVYRALGLFGIPIPSGLIYNETKDL